jgi:hypothetical protein
VRERIYRVAARLKVKVFVVSNGSRPVRPPGISNVSMVLVGDTADAADDWIAEHGGAMDVCVTSDIPLASRCLKKGARVMSPIGKQWTEANIGNALAGRDMARHLRELGQNTGGPAPFDEEGPVTVSQCTRYSPAGCITRGDEELSRSIRQRARSRLETSSGARDENPDLTRSKRGGPGLTQTGGTEEKEECLSNAVEK